MRVFSFMEIWMTRHSANEPMWSAIVFDFDGVILESLDIKTRAFAALFDGFPDHTEQIAGYHLNNLGVSRVPFSVGRWVK